MKVTVNNQEQELEDGETVEHLLDRLGRCGPYTLVELNGEPLERERYSDARLSAGDVVVVAGPVAGG
jgi:thiamine biosynthesis protein ThiS